LTWQGKTYQTEIEDDDDREELIDDIKYAREEGDDGLIQEILDIRFGASLTTEEEDYETNKENIEATADMLKWYETAPFECEVDGGRLEMFGIPISVPRFLAWNVFKKWESAKDYSAVLNFWRLCSLNPDPQARDDLFQFLEGGNFTLTPSGYFVAYRNVDVMEAGDEHMTRWITKEYVNCRRKKISTSGTYVVKTKDAKEDKRFELMEANQYHLIAEKLTANRILIGSLKEVYESLSDMGGKTTVYTDQFSHTFRIKIGELVKMERKACNSNPGADCSYGLHVGNKSFLTSGSFGSTGLAVLVDPSKVVAVPKHNPNKMRVCEYFPIAVVDYKDNQIDEIDTTVFEHGYTQYSEMQLQKMIKDANIVELEESLVIPEGFTMDMLRNHATSLTEMMDVIRNRVVKV
jgi:hypothetical protein